MKQIQTRLGPVNVRATGGNSCIVSADQFMVNGGGYKLLIRLELDQGQWYLSQKDGKSEDSLSATRTGEHLPGRYQASDAARRKILDTIVPAVREHFEKNHDLLIEGALFELRGRKDTLNTELTTLRQQLQSKQNDLYLVENKMAGYLVAK